PRFPRRRLRRLTPEPDMPQTGPVRLRLEALEGRALPAADFRTLPEVPVIDAGMKRELRDLLAAGLELGNRPDVFIKVGDSNTQTVSPFAPLGSPAYDPADPRTAGAAAGAADTVRFFRAAADEVGDNSFNRASTAAIGGSTVAQAADAL